MTNKIGFDNDLYLKEQTAAILERVNMFDNKLYLEFRGSCFLTTMRQEFYPGSTPM